MKTFKHYYRSFKFRLMTVFGTIMIITIVLLNMLSYYNSVDVVEKNMEELFSINLLQTCKSVNTTLGAYEDLLYQIYSDDEIVKLTDNIIDGENIAVNRNQMRRILRGMANVKKDIKSITIITSGGDMVFYDKLTASTTNSWLDEKSDKAENLFRQISVNNHTEVLKTEQAKNYTTKPSYIFHVAHRIIDYRKINKKNGIAIISIDASLLDRICNENMTTGADHSSSSISFIIDQNGYLISYPEEGMLGLQIFSVSSTEEERENSVMQLVKESRILPGEAISIRNAFDQEHGWYYYSVSDQSRMITQLKQQQKWTITVMVISILGINIIVYILSGHLTTSIRMIVKAMKKAEDGEMSVQVEIDKNMPLEVETIAEQFNRMIRELKSSMEKEKRAVEKQKNAEILALEAQINPHFLYNMLDTINWMALDKDEYEISDTINALGHILRYGISNSTGIVTIRMEMQWLEKYILLQKSRLKNAFDCVIRAEAETLDCHIHKLLFQPFVENAFIHGFEGVKRHHKLEIVISEAGEKVRILIRDNGKGMNQEMIDKILKGEEIVSQANNHIGIRNAIGRLYMYYPEDANVMIESEMDVGTSIIIEISKR